MDPFLALGPRGSAGTREQMGSKAFNLSRMAALGLNVPQAFVLPTSWCSPGDDARGPLSQPEIDHLAGAVRHLELATGLAFGAERRPLLVAVRSGAPQSMPGMMDTLLNVGLNEETISGLLRLTGNPRLTWDSYRRLIRQFAEIVDGCDARPFDQAVARILRQERVQNLADLDYRGLRAMAGEFLEIHAELAGRRFPRAPMEQLVAAVEAVHRSWWSERARQYRRLNGIPDAPGTAVTVQRMVFGNAGSNSGAGVAFTRNPASGENQLYVDFAFNAQGEDVVSGRESPSESASLGERMPATVAALEGVRVRLEREFLDAQEIEFTVQEGELFLLQTRTGKRTPLAALRIAVEMVQSGLVEPAQALRRLEGLDLDALRETRRLPEPGACALARGVGASVGVASGRIALDLGAAQSIAAKGAPVILVRREMSPDDVAGIAIAGGVLTAAGGRTAHAAVVARQLGKVCVVGCAGLRMESAPRRIRLGDRTLLEGDWVSLDGESGEVWAGKVAVESKPPAALLETVRGWKTRKLTPHAASR
jgi:pyruvate, orthophosphate dikinase